MCAPEESLKPKYPFKSISEEANTEFCKELRKVLACPRLPYFLSNCDSATMPGAVADVFISIKTLARYKADLSRLNL